MEMLRIKSKFLWPILKGTAEPELGKQLRLAANEALALAADEPFPLLVLPELLEEKVRGVQLWFKRQQHIRAATRSLFEDWLAGAKRAREATRPRIQNFQPTLCLPGQELPFLVSLATGSPATGS